MPGQPPYGVPPEPGFGPGLQGMPAPGPQAMAPPTAGPGPLAGAGAAMMGTLPSAGVGGQSPTRRNALMTFLVPLIVIVGGGIVSSILTFVLAMISPGLAVIGSLLSTLSSLAGIVLYVLSAIKMVNEVKIVTRNPAFPWWPMLVPIYGIYWAWMMVPTEVARAKQIMGVQTPPRSMVLYIFLWHFALASDINDLVR